MDSREVALTESRENLARAVTRLDKLARTALETIGALKRENAEVNQRLAEIEQRTEQERHLGEQRERLIRSSQEDIELRASEIERLQTSNRELLAETEELKTAVDQLEHELGESILRMTARDENDRLRLQEIAELRQKLADEEERSARIASERDEFKSAAYQRERELSQWSLKLTPDAQSAAIKAIDRIVTRVEKIEHAIEKAEVV